MGFLLSRRDLRRRWVWFCAVVAIATILNGCNRTKTAAPANDAPTAEQPARNVAALPRTTQQGPSIPDQASEGVRERWQAHYIGEAKVGYGRTTITSQDDGLLRIDSEEEMTLDRGGVTVTTRVEIVSVEKPGGGLVRFESRANLGPTATESRGEVSGGKLQIETTVQGTKVAGEIPWKPEWGGFFASDLSLESDPLQPGESRTLVALQPLVNQPGEIQLQAKDFEETTLIAGSRKLLRIDGRMTVAGEPIPMTLWTDERGETWKTYIPNLQQTTYRADRKLALTKSDKVYDLFDDITIRIDKPLARGHDSRRVTYRARLKEGDASEAFPSGAAQTVRRVDERTAEITVFAVRPDQPPQPPGASEPPIDADLAPGSLVQSDDPRLVAMAKGVAPDETDPWQIAVALEKYVNGAITQKNFSQAFATAAEVAQTREGDCTEHAVLLGALCRARNIPARCAMGLVYFPAKDGPAFAYHMWTQVWISDRWIPLDGTLGRGGIGGGHLELANSNLEGAGPYAAFLPVFRVLGQLELEVISEE
jgi:transglutaminase-like putative cysteine protease